MPPVTFMYETNSFEKIFRDGLHPTRWCFSHFSWRGFLSKCTLLRGLVQSLFGYRIQKAFSDWNFCSNYENRHSRTWQYLSGQVRLDEWDTWTNIFLAVMARSQSSRPKPSRPVKFYWSYVATLVFLKSLWVPAVLLFNQSCKTTSLFPHLLPDFFLPLKFYAWNAINNHIMENFTSPCKNAIHGTMTIYNLKSSLVY